VAGRSASRTTREHAAVVVARAGSGIARTLFVHPAHDGRAHACVSHDGAGQWRSPVRAYHTMASCAASRGLGSTSNVHAACLLTYTPTTAPPAPGSVMHPPPPRAPCRLPGRVESRATCTPRTLSAQPCASVPHHAQPCAPRHSTEVMLAPGSIRRRAQAAAKAHAPASF
jgi:hypothetical protein